MAKVRWVDCAGHFHFPFYWKQCTRTRRLANVPDTRPTIAPSSSCTGHLLPNDAQLCVRNSWWRSDTQVFCTRKEHKFVFTRHTTNDHEVVQNLSCFPTDTPSLLSLLRTKMHTTNTQAPVGVEKTGRGVVPVITRWRVCATHAPPKEQEVTSPYDIKAFLDAHSPTQNHSCFE